jgi:hypothetical protein
MLTESTGPGAYQRGQGIAYVTPVQVLREVCPYRGLGRQDAVRQVLGNLAQQQRLMLLLGRPGRASRRWSRPGCCGRSLTASRAIGYCGSSFTALASRAVRWFEESISAALVAVT